jgi:hypothetical protein
MVLASVEGDLRPVLTGEFSATGDGWKVMVARSLTEESRLPVLCSIVIIERGASDDLPPIPPGMEPPGSFSQACSPLRGEPGTLVAESDSGALLVSSSISARNPMTIGLLHSAGDHRDTLQLDFKEIQLSRSSVWIAAEEVARTGPSDRVDVMPVSGLAGG